MVNSLIVLILRVCFQDKAGECNPEDQDTGVYGGGWVHEAADGSSSQGGH